MKSTMTVEPIVPPRYPYLAILKDPSDVTIVVLFTKPSSGTIVSTNNEVHYPLGYTTTKWEEDNFTYFHGSVVLSN